MSAAKGLPRATLMYPEFHNEVERLLLEKRLTRKETCNLMGVDRHTITIWESGRRQPENYQMEALAEILGTRALFDLIPTIDTRTRTVVCPRCGRMRRYD